MSFGELRSHVANKADEITAMYDLFKFNPHRDIRDRVQLTDVDHGKMHLCDFVVHKSLPEKIIEMRQIYLSFKCATQVLLNTECTRRLATPSHYLSKSGLSPQASPSLKIFSLLTKVKRKAMVATSCDRKDVHVPYQGGT